MPGIDRWYLVESLNATEYCAPPLSARLWAVRTVPGARVASVREFQSIMLCVDCDPEIVSEGIAAIGAHADDDVEDFIDSYEHDEAACADVVR